MHIIRGRVALMWLMMTMMTMYCIRWVQIPKGTGQFSGVVRPIEKHYESLLRCTQQNDQ